MAAADGIIISISTSVISALVGAGGGGLAVWRISKSKCAHCSDHDRLEASNAKTHEDISAIKEDISAIKESNKSMGHSLDVMREDIRFLLRGKTGK